MDSAEARLLRRIICALAFDCGGFEEKANCKSPVP